MSLGSPSTDHFTPAQQARFAEQAAEADALRTDGYVPVTQEFALGVRAQRQAEGRAVFNGCTHVWLAEVLGDTLTHVANHGWFYKPTTTD